MYIYLNTAFYILLLKQHNDNYTSQIKIFRLFIFITDLINSLSHDKVFILIDANFFSGFFF